MTAFEELALIYDQSINWSVRLNHELPFITNLIPGTKNRRILDLACGSGRHAIALAKQGFSVIGLDSSSAMINAAQQHAQDHHVVVKFHKGDMRNAQSIVQGPFDLILCFGNSLALLPSSQALQETLNGVHSLLGQKGMFVAQVLNFDEIRHSGFRFFPLKSGITSSGKEVVFARFFELIKTAETAQLIFTSFIKTSSKWQTKTFAQTVLQLTKPLLEVHIKNAGFRQFFAFADYNKNSFSLKESRNLVIVALS
ncbi:MAG: class I SAM-dependent methyltransferase [Candidatus Thorarchaeota archaeon]